MYYHVSPDANLTAVRAGTCLTHRIPTVTAVDAYMDDAASSLRWGQPVYLYAVHTQSVEDRTEMWTDGETTSVGGRIYITTTAVPVAAPVVIA